MISLVQVLIAAVLIPVSFGAPAADDSEPTSTIRPLAFVTAIPTYLLSHNGTCGEGTDYMCEVGICCSKYGVVELRKITVELVVSRNLVHAIPLGWSNIGNRCTMAGVEEESISIVTKKMLLATWLLWIYENSTVVLAASRHLVYAIPLIRLTSARDNKVLCGRQYNYNAHQTFVARNMGFW
ncbi:hypothetical protein BASA62_006624 [Batrachochytrium salamandrivorans]|nr:hypothetical protein BASA62_006624 [Batrachochytrium salamandrivorans]